MWNTIAGSILSVGGHYDYREGVSVWYRSFLAFNPDPELMAEAPLGLPAARAGRLRPVRALAVHPARARLQRAGGLPDPALHRLPLARRTRGHGGRQPISEPRLGATMSDEITDLQKAGEELLALARESSDGRSSRAVVHGERMRAVLMALVNGTGLGEHDAPAAATFQVVSGRARLIAGDRVWEVPAGARWCRSRRSGTAWRPTRTQ